MVRPDVVGRKVASAVACLRRAEALFAAPREDFLADRDRRDLAIFQLFLAIEEAISLASHWVADENLGPADDAGSTFYVLAQEQRLDRALAERMKAAAGLRNLIAHNYFAIDPDRLYREFAGGLEAVKAFLAVVAKRAGFSGIEEL